MELEIVVHRVREEFREMPGLRLTPAQATRLWGLEREMACAVIERLVGSCVPALDRVRVGDPGRKLEV